MEDTKIIKCTCHNEYQDKVYGQGNRVGNRTKQNANGKDYRCTVCGKSK